MSDFSSDITAFSSIYCILFFEFVIKFKYSMIITYRWR